MDASPAPPPTPNFPTLRVMRLYKPSLSIQEPHGYYAGADAMLGGGSRVLSPQADFAVGHALLLPESFGNIYVGQTFTAYVSVLNHHGMGEAPVPGMYTLQRVKCDAALTTPTKKMVLSDVSVQRGCPTPSPNPSERLEAGESLDLVVQVPLEVMGTHTLQVTVTCVDPRVGSEAHSFRKNYRFNVLKPLAIHLRCAAVGPRRFVQAAVRNLTHGAITVAGMAFETMPGSPYAVIERPLPQPGAVQGAADAAKRIFSAALDAEIHIGANEMFTRVYELAPTVATPAPASPRPGGEPRPGGLGRVRLAWRNAMGEEGVVMSAEAVAEEPPRRVVSAVLDLPERGIVHGALQGKVTVTNNLNRSLELQLQLRDTQANGLLALGKSFVNLGSLGPGAKAEATLDFLPVSLGLRQVVGVVLVDMVTAMEYPQGTLGTVLIVADPGAATHELDPAED